MATPLLMMSNRNKDGDGLGDRIAAMRYYEFKAGKLGSIKSWTEMSQADFTKRLQAVASNFPLVPDDQNEQQRHVSVFVHGFNNTWVESAERYAQIHEELFDERDLGAPILFAWPSNGSAAGYLPDREDARACSKAFALELVGLHDHLRKMQSLAASTQDPAKGCRAKISIIAHSMGNFVTQKALAVAAKQLNSPQLLTLVTQLAMVAADVDNDLFQKDKATESDGSLMANVCYRIGALYTGLDQVLGASAGLKHFGTRRLGRSGLADRSNVWDNVFDHDVTALLDTRKNIHSGVFLSPKAMDLLEEVLRGVDRGQL
ncbi:MAG TPA: alpha/beta hydrolase [Steroidobacteraceae bacterium]|nr:alpha/beta hydrolase [Steroidobacteraceae bacterium]